MNNLRIENKDIYRIEVNDDGEYIEFDLNDIGLTARFTDALEKIKEIQKETEEKYSNLNIKLDEEKDDEITLELTKEYIEIEKKMFQDMRNAMDMALGKNACQKIFGDRNYYEMYSDLLEELSKPRKELKGKSHLDMISKKSEDIHKRIRDKYKKIKEVTI